MKAVLVSKAPKIVANVLNEKASILIFKKFPKDYKGWVYIYCTKNGHYLTKGKSGNVYPSCCISNGIQEWHLNGKVVARFYCDKVEEIKPIYVRFYLGGSTLDGYRGIDLPSYKLVEMGCLKQDELCEYLGGDTGYAIHISQLEIFDKPKELSEFVKCESKHIRIGNCFIGFGGIPRLTKAPANYCYVEVEVDE